VAAAAAAVASAQAALDAATRKRDDLRNGATDIQKANAQAAVDSAEAALASAQAKRARRCAGPTQTPSEQGGGDSHGPARGRGRRSG
jgi:hypothetical protein